MFKAFRDSLKENPYNQAITHFQKLGHLDPDSPAYSTALLKVATRCQLAIQQQPEHGDAHVLLANAYLLAALSFPYGDVYPYALVRSAAVIQHCMTVPMRISEQQNASRVFHRVEDELAAERPSWAGEIPPNDMVLLL